MVKSNQTYYRKQETEDHKLQNGHNDNAFECSMLFANRKELFVTNGSKINIYNSTGGGLIEVLKGHSGKVVSLCKNLQDAEGIVSCDEKGQVFKWYSNRNHPDHGSSFNIPLGENVRIYHFSVGKSIYVCSFESRDSSSAKLAIINVHRNNNKKFVISKEIQFGQYKVALSHDERFVAALTEETRRVFIADITNKNNLLNKTTRYHKMGKSDHCCIAFHPTKDILATGDETGAIFLWHHILQIKPVKLKLHWHHMPLRTFCFSSTGGDLFSGGEECVLVRWKLSQDNNKSFLPRLGMPIRNIQIDPYNSFVAVMHSDQSISIIDSERMKLEGSIQQISRHIPLAVDGGKLLTIGLLYHSQTASFIINGKTGHLQFFNPYLLKVNYNLDITMANFVTEERHKKLPNSDVTNASISDDGVWLITVELCQLTQTIKEVVMKFWKFSSEQQRWELNTSIQTPHGDAITSLTFMNQCDDDSVCVSCSEDNKFKVWKLITYVDGTGIERSHWNSRITRGFRNLAATASAFASDNSLLAVAFENIVTLWTPEEVILKRLLTQPYLTQRITDVSFSSGNWEGSALVTRSENYICSWDLLSCSLMWRVYIKSSFMSVDRTTGLMAVFAKNKQVYFFKPQSSKVISSNYTLQSEAVCAQFAPFSDQTNEPTQKKEVRRCLYYFDKEQNFLRLELPTVVDNDSDEKLPIEPTAVESTKSNNESKSNLMSALSAKTKYITKKSVDEDMINVNLSAPSVTNLMKDLKDVQIHSVSFLDFASHISSFLPSLSDVNVKEEKAPTIKYETIQERKKSNITAFNKAYLVDEALRIESLQKVDFNKMLQELQS